MENEPIISYLVSNQEHLQEMIAPLTKQRDELLKVEPTEFRDDIEREYLDAVRTTIALEVALTSSGFNLDLLTLKILLEEIDLKQYLEPKENS